MFGFVDSNIFQMKIASTGFLTPPTQELFPKNVINKVYCNLNFRNMNVTKHENKLEDTTKDTGAIPKKSTQRK